MCLVLMRKETRRGSQGEKKPSSREACTGRGKLKELVAVPAWEDSEESSNLPGEEWQEDLGLLMSQFSSKEHLPSS